MKGPTGAEALRVAAFVERYLEPEQTFIYRQMTELPRCTLRFVARHRVPGSPYPEERVMWLDSGPARPIRGLRWKLRRLRQRLTGRYNWLSPAERVRLSDCLDSFAPHLVHAHWGPDALLVEPICAARSIPLLVHFHGYDVSRLAADPVYVASLRRLFERMVAAITVSEHMREVVIGLGCPAERVKCHHTGVPETYFAAVAAPPSGHALILLQVGRLAPKKGYEDTLAALAKYAARDPAVRLRIVGEGPLRAALEARMAALGIRERVDLLGRRTPEQVLTELRTAGALLLPSRTAPDGDIEGLPNVAVEAMACGLPVIGTRHGGIPEALRYSEPNWLVGEGDADALAARIERLASGPELWRRLSAEGRAIAQRDFHLPTQNARLRALYDELLESAR